MSEGLPRATTEFAGPDRDAEIAIESQRLLRGTAAAVAALAVGALVAAMVGSFSLLVVTAIAIPGAVLLWRLLPASVKVVGIRTPTAVWILAGLVALAATIWNFTYSAELVITGRDGGTYANTARGLLTWGELLPQVIEPPFDVPGVSFEAPGFVLREDGRLYQQFLHAGSAVFAVGGLVGGSAGLWGANALVGGAALLMLFGLARSLMGPWLALTVQASLALALPFVYFSRATFSEPLTLFFVAAGLWAANAALDQRSTRMAVGAGFLLGGAPLVRVDGWIVLLGIATTGLVALFFDREEHSEARQRIFTVLWRTALSVAVLGLIDAIVFSAPYIGIVGTELAALMVATLIVEALRRGLQRANTEGLRRRIASLSWLGGVLAIAVVVLALYAAVIRPFVVELYGDPYGPGILQGSELEGGSTRTLYERSFWWLVWYLGLGTVSLGVAGAAALVFRVNKGLMTGPLLTAVIVLQSALLYLWRPSINPDHIWASRRFLPIVIPGCLLLAGVALSMLKSLGGRGTRVMSAVLASTMVVGAAVPTLPSWDLVEASGADELILSICEALPDQAAVLVVDTSSDRPSTFFAQPVRAWCDVPVAAITDDQLDDLFPPLLAGADASGRELIVLTTLVDHPALAGGVTIERFSGELTFLEETLLGPPKDRRQGAYFFSLVRVS